MNKRIFGRLPRQAYTKDLKEVVGPLRTYPYLIDTFINKRIRYVLSALTMNDYRVTGDNKELGRFNNQYLAEEAFKELRRKYKRNA